MKKFLAVVLAMTMVLALAACGGNGGSETPATAGGESAEQTQTGGEIAQAVEKVAMITDYGDITDQSFNQTTYEACKQWCEANGADFTYFKPVSDSDDDRVAMIDKAVDEGYNVIVMPGYAFGPAIAATAPEYEDVTFIAIDVSEGDLGDGFELPANLYCCVYQEELCGYMAGYATVAMGYKNLAFLGGMAVPAVVRYGYGYVQGVNDAAQALGIDDIKFTYGYANAFSGDADITAAMDTWYGNGVEVVFACGGGIYTSVAEAAAKVDGKVVGVDVDQAPIIDALQKKPGMTITSAMKGLAVATKAKLDEVKNGTFVGGKSESLGLVSENPEENYVGIPLETTQWTDTFTQDDYKAMVADMLSGKLTVSNDISKSAGDFATAIDLTDVGAIK